MAKNDSLRLLFFLSLAPRVGGGKNFAITVLRVGTGVERKTASLISLLTAERIVGNAAVSLFPALRK